jgi:hypothetical protein
MITANTEAFERSTAKAVAAASGHNMWVVSSDERHGHVAVRCAASGFVPDATDEVALHVAIAAAVDCGKVTVDVCRDTSDAHHGTVVTVS